MAQPCRFCSLEHRISPQTMLLGCFMAGVSFASVEGALDAWNR